MKIDTIKIDSAGVLKHPTTIHDSGITSNSVDPIAILEKAKKEIKL